MQELNLLNSPPINISTSIVFFNTDYSYYISSNADIVNYDSSTTTPNLSWNIKGTQFYYDTESPNEPYEPNEPNEQISFVTAKLETNNQYLTLVENNEEDDTITYSGTLTDSADCNINLSYYDCTSSSQSSCQNSLSCFYIIPDPYPSASATLMYVYYNDQMNQVCINTNILPTQNNDSVQSSFTFSEEQANGNDECEYYVDNNKLFPPNVSN